MYIGKFLIFVKDIVNTTEIIERKSERNEIQIKVNN